jgi:hypothetical protein
VAGNLFLGFMIAFVLGFSPDAFSSFELLLLTCILKMLPLTRTSTKLTTSDDVGVKVTTTPTGRYNTNIQKQLTSGDGGVATESSSLSEYKNAQKYKVFS